MSPARWFGYINNWSMNVGNFRMRPFQLCFLALCLLLTGGAPSKPSSQGVATGAEVKISLEKACQEEDEVVFICRKGACGFYRCRDVAVREPVLTRGVVVVAPPATGSAIRRWGTGQEGMPGQAEPVFEIPWNTPPRPLLPSEQAAAEESAKRPKVKHHIFPFAFKTWFERQGIASIHQYTLLMEVPDHERIHQGANGGPWNQAWRDFIASHPAATKHEIWNHAAELCARFQLFGIVVPYYGPRPR